MFFPSLATVLDDSVMQLFTLYACRLMVLYISSSGGVSVVGMFGAKSRISGDEAAPKVLGGPAHKQHVRNIPMHTYMYIIKLPWGRPPKRNGPRCNQTPLPKKFWTSLEHKKNRPCSCAVLLVVNIVYFFSSRQQENLIAAAVGVY
jgi:hypothetical protein